MQSVVPGSPSAVARAHPPQSPKRTQNGALVNPTGRATAKVPDSRSRALLVSDCMGSAGGAAHQPEVASWPVTAMSQLQQQLTLLTREMDGRGNPVLRAEALVQCLRTMGESMRSYGPFFDAFVCEVQHLIGLYGGQRDRIHELERHVEQEDVRVERELSEQNLRQSRELRDVMGQLEEQRRRAEVAESERIAAERKMRELERDKRKLEQTFDDSGQRRKAQDELVVQLAHRNRGLSEQLAVEEETVKSQRQRLEELVQSNQFMANEMNGMSRKLQDATQGNTEELSKLREALEESLNQNRRLAASLQALRATKENNDDELSKTVCAASELKEEWNKERERLTPRPHYSQTELMLGGDSSTVERYAALSRRALEATARAESLKAENVTFRTALKIMDVPSDLSPSTSCVASCEASLPDTVVDRRSLPPYLQWPASITKLSIRPLTLTDATMRAKELLDYFVSFAGRTSKPVEAHMALLLFFVEGFQNFGQFQQPFGKHYAPYTAQQREDLFPVGLYEAMAAVTRSWSVWTQEPVLRALGAVVRAELGIWVWKEQQTLVTSLLTQLEADSPAVATQHLDTIARALAPTLPVATVTAVQCSFLQCYSQPEGGAGETLPRVPSISHPRRRPTDPNATFHSSKQITVKWDRTSVTEDRFVRMLRHIHLNTVLSFYVQYEWELVLASLKEEEAIPPFHLLHERLQTLSLSAAVALDVLVSLNHSVPSSQLSQYVQRVLNHCAEVSNEEVLGISKRSLVPTPGCTVSALTLVGQHEHYFGTFRAYPSLNFAVGTKPTESNHRRRSSVRRPSVSSPTAASPRRRDSRATAGPPPEPNTPAMELLELQPRRVPFVLFLRVMRRVPISFPLTCAVHRPEVIANDQSIIADFA